MGKVKTAIDSAKWALAIQAGLFSIGLFLGAVLWFENFFSLAGLVSLTVLVFSVTAK